MEATPWRRIRPHRGSAQCRLPPAGAGTGIWRQRADIGVAAGLADIGDRTRGRHLPASPIDAVLKRVAEMLEENIDRMKTQAEDATLMAVGGGEFLVPEKLAGCGRVLRVEHADVANAVGAAIAQVIGRGGPDFQRADA